MNSRRGLLSADLMARTHIADDRKVEKEKKQQFPVGDDCGNCEEVGFLPDARVPFQYLERPSGRLSKRALPRMSTTGH